MNQRSAHTGDLRGRAAALAAFDRSDDRRGHAPLAAEHRPDPEPVRDRGPELLTHLRFDHDVFTLDVWVRAEGGMRSLSGQVVEEDPDYPRARVQVRRPDRTLGRRVALDGSFGVTDLAPGPVSLVVEYREYRHDSSIVTDWFTV
ncbi:hypothetical protein IDM40_07755 [Nocardiopsis sp. HNM0947]|uniref:Uncharacterized protein n=1 Tax=Nocardiopsis coralli TaxID=2772213 RepID=A0ABR9P424_9ACTN|nr:hypothetical protein [Nocardiopsis coralli]MBE2998597.1 hypothetical protein [Nocardiopsis coralli]